MNIELIILLCWAFLSLLKLIIAIIRLKRCRKVWLSLLLTYFIAQPFSWTILSIGNGGGFIITPIPDLIAIVLFFTGFVTYEYGDRSINACIPPSPISSIIVFVIVFFIARRFKSVAYHHWFRRKVNKVSTRLKQVR